VSAGQAVTLTIARSAGQAETGYVIYRSRLNGGNVVSGTNVAGLIGNQNSDFREIVRIPASGNSTTTWTDLNADVPGTTKAFGLNLRPSDTAVVWRQLLPMLKFGLYPTNAAVIPWAQLLFGYLRLSKRRHLAVIKNVVTSSQAWRPFN
jgi:hypothetical protein